MLVTLTLAVALAGQAHAAPPPLLSVGQEDRHPTATYSLPGVDDATVYMAASPDRSSDGRFLSENIADLDILTADEIAAGSWLYETQLDPGTYYLMLRASDYECSEDPDCIDGYSNVLALTIPLPTLTASGAKSIVRRALARKFGAGYEQGFGKRIKSCRRLSRLSFKCRGISWVIGDVVFHSGRLAARRVWSNGDAGWRAIGRIKETNELCVFLGKRRCTRSLRIRVSGTN